MRPRLALRKLLRRFGYDATPFDVWHSASLRRAKLFAHHGITLVFDVGANVGLYALELRKEGYEGRIVSFEPLAQVFPVLQARAATDTRWEAFQLALGAVNQSAAIQVAANVESSSLLNMLPRHAEAAPEAVYVGQETVTVRTLDSVFDTHVSAEDRVFLKIDAQGYERYILDGAHDSLPRITGLQVEMSLVPLYEDEVLYDAMIDRLAAIGFTLMSLETGFSDPQTGQLLQMDGLFFRA